MSVAVDWFEIPVKDEARARKFYEAVLDIEMGTMSGGDTEVFAFMGDDGPAGCLTTQDSSPMAGGVLVYLSCETIKRAQASHGKWRHSGARGNRYWRSRFLRSVY